MSMAVGLEGRPLTRDEERRIAALATERQPASWSPGERQPGSRSVSTTHRYTTLNPMAEFGPLFVLGMLAGSEAVFFALFIL